MSMLALLTFLRADMYGSDFRRTQIESSYHPESPRSNYEAGALMVNMYSRQPQPILRVLAEKHFEKTNILDPASKLGFIGMLQLDCLSGDAPRPELVDELNIRLSNSAWDRTDRIVMHGIAEMSTEGTLCLTREQVDRLFASAIANFTASIADRSVVRSDYALYLWIKEKDYLAARSVLELAISENKQDILNRFNLLQLLRLIGDNENAKLLISDLSQRNLDSEREALLISIIGEMTHTDSSRPLQ